MKLFSKKGGQKIKNQFKKRARVFGAKSKDHITENLVERVGSVRRVRLFIVEWLLLVLAIILFAILQSSWQSAAYESRVFVRGGTYSEGIVGTIKSLNPIFADSAPEYIVSKLMFESLVTKDTSGHLKNQLATEIKPLEKGKIWQISLTRDHKWSDGTPLTVADIIYTFNLIKDPKLKTVSSGTFTATEIKQIDDHTLQFILPAAYSSFPESLTFPILPAHILADTPNELVYEHDFSLNPIGSGPFTFNQIRTSQINAADNVILLDANPNYIGGSPTVEHFELRVYADADRLVRSLNLGSVTATSEPLAGKEIANTSVYSRRAGLNRGVFMYFNTQSQTLSKSTIRSAIRSGLDLTAIRADMGDKQRFDYPILDDDLGIEYPGLPEYDLEKSREAIKKAGYNAETSDPIQLYAVDTPEYQKLTEIIKKYFADLELNLEVTLMPSQDLVLSIIQPRAYDILLYETDLGTNPDPYAYYHSSQAISTGLNLSDYRSALVDDAILAARTNIDTAYRVSKYEAFLKLWLKDTPSIGLYRSELTYYYNKNIQTFSEDSRLSAPLDRFADVLDWAVARDLRLKTP